ncbi:MAG: hypothetical protein QXH00_06545 [Candidatus Jordarchaeales archaeon]
MYPLFAVADIWTESPGLCQYIPGAGFVVPPLDGLALTVKPYWVA